MLADKLLEYHKIYQPKILVIGDLMLDHYIFGHAGRLSPEAPVPVVNVRNESKIIGGAGNVANNIISLGGQVSISGVVGEDIFGHDICRMLSENRIETEAISVEKNRPTTIKTRVLASNHQIVRIDREETNDISHESADLLFNSLKPKIDCADLIILSDYNKGLLTPLLCQNIIQHARAAHKKVLVDPKGKDYSKYKGAFVIKPNKKELAETSQMERLTDHADLQLAAEKVFKQTQAENLVVTLSEEGIALIDHNQLQLFPVQAREVFDVTGAGDTVIATMAYCVALGLGLEEACQVANYAAAIVIRHVGSACTTIEEILDIMQN